MLLLTLLASCTYNPSTADDDKCKFIPNDRCFGCQQTLLKVFCELSRLLELHKQIEELASKIIFEIRVVQTCLLLMTSAGYKSMQKGKMQPSSNLAREKSPLKPVLSQEQASQEAGWHGQLDHLHNQSPSAKPHN